MKTAFVCYNVQEKYTLNSVQDEDALLLEFLKRKGLDIYYEVWTNETINWSDYELVLIKAPWDYHENITAFYNWLDLLKSLSIPMFNPYEIIKWNCDKHYLKDISAAGLSIIPTLFIEKNTIPQLDSFFKQLNSEKLIIKPCVSASAKNTFVLTPQNYSVYQKNILELLKEDAFLVQLFIKEIETEGELSFIFFDGKYSHSVVKTPRSGDFRVQQCHGGITKPITASASQITTAQKFVDKFAKGCLYARVDGVMVNDEFQLMELELIEPYLFLSHHPESYENYYSGLKKLVDSNMHTNKVGSALQ